LNSVANNDQACPACGSKQVQDKGPLPTFPQGYFCGSATNIKIPSGHLKHCDSCALEFRYPVLAEDEITRLYENLPESTWAGGIEVRPYWPAIKSQIDQRNPRPKVLDVGCFTGEFLRWLPQEWIKYGIEPSLKAAEQASQNGIHVLGRTADVLETIHERFDVILACDVIEHLTNPVKFIRQLTNSLAPGGLLIILTGATDSWPYRLFGRHFWYGSFPEHVTFYCRSWFEWVAARMELQMIHHEFLTTEHRHWPAWLAQMLRLALHAGVRLMIERGISPLSIARLPFISRVVKWQATPWWKQSTDHGLIVLRKETQA
jgi:SAM-dependent methyltransferase